jgi:hypothetical protein
MEVSGQLHALVALPPGKSPWYSLDIHFYVIIIPQILKYVGLLYIEIDFQSLI